MSQSSISLTFLGAAGEVTGSSYLVTTPSVKFTVDCGMFQGGREADEKNRNALSFDVKTLDFAMVTHAHIDHCGLLPRLTAFGFKGPIYGSPATCALVKIMLEDSARIQEKEAFDRNKRSRERKEKLPELAPLYTVEQARECIAQLTPVEWDIPTSLHKDVTITLRNTGHILGSASIDTLITAGEVSKRIVFSGDVGSPNRILVPDPVSPPAADVLLIESTYGNRKHRTMEETRGQLVEAIERAHANKGNVIIPAFALGRTQELMIVLLDLVSQGKIKNPPQVFIDSPLAEKATEITWKFMRDTDAESQALIAAWRAGKIPLKVNYSATPDDSRAINAIKSGALIMAGSGMCEAGRIRHHLLHNLGRPECSIVFAGYQGEGTLGRAIIDKKPSVKIMREEIPVRAQVYTLGGLSAHADQPGLISFMRGIKQAPAITYLVHGDRAVMDEFGKAIAAELGWKTLIPSIGQVVEI
jgi:metallo-beta-lactamase family protein